MASNRGLRPSQVGTVGSGKRELGPVGQVLPCADAGGDGILRCLDCSSMVSRRYDICHYAPVWRADCHVIHRHSCSRNHAQRNYLTMKGAVNPKA